MAMRRGLLNAWKFFKFFDSALLGLSLNVLSFATESLCFSAYFDLTQSAVFSIHIFICILFELSSSLELLSFNHEFNKRLLLFFLGCKMKTSGDEKNKTTGWCARIFWFFFALPFGIWYLFCYVTVTLVRLCDIRQFFGRNINYNLNNFLNYLFKVCLYAYSIGSLIPIIVSSSKCTDTNIYLPIVCVVLVLLRLTQRSIYFFFFQIFTPPGLEQAQITVNQNKVEPISTIENVTPESSRRETLEKVKATRKQKRFCFSSKYVFESGFCRFVRMSEMGTMGCISSSSCSSIDLEHIFYCHDDLNVPNARCRCCYNCTDRAGFLIGFHQTSREAALCIALSPMRISEGENGWFGDGVYFARSLDQTNLKIGNEGGKGALIIAMIDMGNMKVVKDQRETAAQRHGGSGRDEGYDSVYVVGQGVEAKQFEEENEEFVVYDPARIKAYIVCV